MKFKLIIILLIIAAISALLLPVNDIKAEADPIGVSNNLFYIDTPKGGEATISIGIDNGLDQEMTIEVSNWYDYTAVGDNEVPIDPSWVTSIAPASQTLPKNGSMIANIVYTIPDNAPEIQYKTWIKIKVLDYPQVGGYWEKPITVLIRKGEAMGVARFSASPTYYRLLVDQKDARIDVNTFVDQLKTPILIKNKSSVIVDVYPTIEAPDHEITITSDSSIKHTEEEIGIVFEPIETEMAQEWFSSEYNRDNPLSLAGYEQGYLTWSLEVPNDVKNGHYAMAIRVQPITGQGMVVQNYLIWLLLDVDRPSDNGFNYYWLLLLLIPIILYVIINSTREILRIRKEDLATEKDN